MLSRCAQGLNQIWRCVPMDQGPPRHHVVEIPVAIDVFDCGTAAPVHEDRRATDRLEGADGAIDSAWQDSFCSLKELSAGDKLLHARGCDAREAARRHARSR